MDYSMYVQLETAVANSTIAEVPMTIAVLDANHYSETVTDKVPQLPPPLLQNQLELKSLLMDPVVQKVMDYSMYVQLETAVANSTIAEVPMTIAVLDANHYSETVTDKVPQLPPPLLQNQLELKSLLMDPVVQKVMDYSMYVQLETAVANSTIAEVPMTIAVLVANHCSETAMGKLPPL
ncbi:hypothetical protein HK103_004429 [Boothiomyces macroporosus]|uniref:Uncharacterized protein n=1 Tax=Boothiomyces macroporosus TaxID=261099 RepID=A0AAD5UCA9_9FUNG|nr:hypothetical protein HK103_004429 [Boothiomyces macroporosus]